MGEAQYRVAEKALWDSVGLQPKEHFVDLARMGARWRWAAYGAGVGSIVAMVATIPLGPDSIAVSIGFMVAFVAIVLWVIWTRRELAS